MIDSRGRLEKIITLSGIGLPYLVETWQDVLGIDATIWARVLTAGGTVNRNIAEEPYHKVILAGIAAGDASRLHTVQEWQLGPDTWGVNTFNKLLIMEWEVKFANVADIDNATFFMGLSEIALATRATNNIAGFILTADVLNSITDDGGAETVKAVGAPVLANWNKFTIVAYNRIIEFWVNEVRQAIHTTAAAENLPDVNAHGQFYLLQEALGAGTGQLHVSTVSIRPGVIV